MTIPTLSAPQDVFLNKLDTKFAAYVGGFGSGKTFVGCIDLLVFAGRNPKVTQGYFAPTYPQIRDIFYPTLEEAAHLMGFRIDVKESNKEVHLFRGAFYYGTIICRSMEKPETIVGFKIARALVDEIDTLTNKKSSQAWNKITARLRLKISGVRNDIRVTTTPEGFKFVYNQFAKDPTQSYSMVQASTYENEEFLPDDYISSLRETYPSQLIDAYLEGEFVNLTSGTVYRAYDRVKHRSNELYQEGEPILVGMDFNIDNMAATVYVRRNEKEFHAVDEISKGYNTPTVANLIKERYPKSRVIIYPDSTGKNRSRLGGASESDIAILESSEYGFVCNYHLTNPPVRDRINATNKAFEANELFINDHRCPQTAASLEQQVYDDNGEPDKTSGVDHQNDATTYPIAFEKPLMRPITNFNVQY